MFIKLANREVVIVGGGETAAQKCRLILKTTARITVMAQHLEPELAALARSGRIAWDTRPAEVAHFRNTALVFIATGNPSKDAALHAIAKSAGALVSSTVSRILPYSSYARRMLGSSSARIDKAFRLAIASTSRKTNR